MHEPRIIASVLGADYMHLADEVADLVAAGVDGIQWDVMDGGFVPPITFGADVVAAARPLTSLPFEAHLMVNHPPLIIENQGNGNSFKAGLVPHQGLANDVAPFVTGV